MEGAPARRRAGAALPGAAADESARNPRREAARQALADDQARPAGRALADLVQRDFRAAEPDQLWVADISDLRFWEGLVFFAFVLDAYSRMIVGWQLAGHMRTDLVLDALKMALGQRGPGADVELIHHSDRGSQPEFKRPSQRCRFTRGIVVRWPAC